MGVMVIIKEQIYNSLKILIGFVILESGNLSFCGIEYIPLRWAEEAGFIFCYILLDVSHYVAVAGLELLVPSDTLEIQPYCTGFIVRIGLNRVERRKSGLVWLLQSYFPYKASTGRKQQRTDWLTPDFFRLIFCKV